MEKKEVIKEVKEEVWIAFDGTEHESEYNCENYELEKRQELLEKEANDKLMIKLEANYPSMINLDDKPEYMHFLIKDESDLDLFIKTYKYWFANLHKYWQVSKETFKYPEVLCILDLYNGESPRLYSMRQLTFQFDSFINELDYVVGQKLETTKEAKNVR